MPGKTCRSRFMVFRAAGAIGDCHGFEELRMLLLEPRENGMLATMLRSKEEGRDAKEAFRGP